jgi:hypothetical protein
MKATGNAKRVLCVSVALLLVVSFFVASSSFAPPSSPKPATVDVYVGVDAAFATVEETKQLIDEVKNYTNLFVLGSTAITWNVTNLNEACQYLNDSGLHFMTFAHPAAEHFLLPAQWVKEAREKWNTNFLGLYAYDEPGGHQIDRDYIFMSAQEASDYSDAASTYVKNLTFYLSLVKDAWEIGSFPLFTSDYALYEYDYKAGYDAVFAEFNWKNNSRQISVALCRGAATLHGKDWGVMVTGHLNETNSGQQVYDDMVYAYENGAKYILVFDYPNLAEGILKQEHLDAMKRFWQYARENPRPQVKASDRVAYVLPKDYGYGFRGAADKVWGLWEADTQSALVWNQASSLVEQYGAKLDIVYEDNPKLNSAGYSKLAFYNGSGT